ncbi:hypothetical protein FFX45_09585 [Thermosynechococcus sp. CL-1]|uniref:hypothetical protein n=1 Tax=Thermosynechococcus sp. CL-1 TaxID=2583530 RepID=UPI00122E8ADA|nr:hypothetical protein [Thermosynechococcus sp. CL-1]QEQ01602.1 hypothetical protein FFX45_09585 [Thermosynechococcus sp. CL-1]
MLNIHFKSALTLLLGMGLVVVPQGLANPVNFRLEVNWPAIAGWQNCSQPKEGWFKVQGPAYLKQVTDETPYLALNYVVRHPVRMARYTATG